MKSTILRAVGVAVLLSGVVMLPSESSFVSIAQAATVRPAVGKPLQQAISLANSGKGAAAMAKVHEAEAAGKLTSSEQAAIAQTRNFIAAKTGSGGSSLGCKAKFATDYNAGRYREVVGPDADRLRKGGGYDFQSQVTVAQACSLRGPCTSAPPSLCSLGNIRPRSPPLTSA